MARHSGLEPAQGQFHGLGQEGGCLSGKGLVEAKGVAAHGEQGGLRGVLVEGEAEREQGFEHAFLDHRAVDVGLGDAVDGFGHGPVVVAGG